ncbi:MAG: TRAP transporter small permease subunit [Oscillospiraceae bacterium]|nr:TRAP transporter small permease subunit [Oscillospiraceae bacterium]
MKQAIRSVGKVMDKANDLMKTFTGYVIFVFMALLFFQVVMRFVFSNPIYGIDEAVTGLMIWSMCLAWCVVYWENEHAVLEFLMKKMPAWFRRIMFNVTNVIILVITWVYIPASWELFQMQKKMPPVGGLPFSKGWYYALPVLVMNIIMLVMCLYKTIAFAVTGDESICAPVIQEGGSVVD